MTCSLNLLTTVPMSGEGMLVETIQPPSYSTYRVNVVNIRIQPISESSTRWRYSRQSSRSGVVEIHGWVNRRQHLPHGTFFWHFVHPVNILTSVEAAYLAAQVVCDVW